VTRKERKKEWTPNKPTNRRQKQILSKIIRIDTEKVKKKISYFVFDFKILKISTIPGWWIKN